MEPQFRVRWKKILLLVLAGILIVFEMFLTIDLFPYSLRHSIVSKLPGPPPPVTHPALDWEFELMYQQHPFLRLMSYAVTLGLLFGIGCCIFLVVKTYRSVPSDQ